MKRVCNLGNGDDKVPLEKRQLTGGEVSVMGPFSLPGFQMASHSLVAALKIGGGGGGIKGLGLFYMIQI